MSYRRKLATLASVKELIETHGALRLWTFTRLDHSYDLEHGIEVALKGWKRVSEWLVRQKGVVGVAVIEEHKTGVLHFHALIPARIYFSIKDYYAICERYGFGNVDYSKQVIDDSGEYACKYLSKKCSAQLKGKRLVRFLNRKAWRVVGQREIKFNSNLHELYLAWSTKQVEKASNVTVFKWWRLAKFLDARFCISKMDKYWKLYLAGHYYFFSASSSHWLDESRGLLDEYEFGELALCSNL